MSKKYLGKITNAEFGAYPDRPFLVGLQLAFKFDNGLCVTDGGFHTINVNDTCKWESEEQKNEAFQKVLKDLSKLLKEAKVNYVSELANKPIEIEIENQMFKSFRILTEVL